MKTVTVVALSVVLAGRAAAVEECANKREDALGWNVEFDRQTFAACCPTAAIEERVVYTDGAACQPGPQNTPRVACGLDGLDLLKLELRFEEAEGNPACACPRALPAPADAVEIAKLLVPSRCAESHAARVEAWCAVFPGDGDCRAALAGKDELKAGEDWKRRLAALNPDAESTLSEFASLGQVEALLASGATGRLDIGCNRLGESCGRAGAYGLEDDTCRPGISVEVRKDGAWQQRMFVPASLKPCRNVLKLRGERYADLFTHELRLVQWGADEACRVRNLCALAPKWSVRASTRTPGLKSVQSGYERDDGTWLNVSGDASGQLAVYLGDDRNAAIQEGPAYYETGVMGASVLGTQTKGLPSICVLEPGETSGELLSALQDNADEQVLAVLNSFHVADLTQGQDQNLSSSSTAAASDVGVQEVDALQNCIAGEGPCNPFGWTMTYYSVSGELSGGETGTNSTSQTPGAGLDARFRAVYSEYVPLDTVERVRCGSDGIFVAGMRNGSAATITLAPQLVVDSYDGDVGAAGSPWTVIVCDNSEAFGENPVRIGESKYIAFRGGTALVGTYTWDGSCYQRVGEFDTQPLPGVDAVLGSWGDNARDWDEPGDALAMILSRESSGGHALRLLRLRDNGSVHIGQAIWVSKNLNPLDMDFATLQSGGALQEALLVGENQHLNKAIFWTVANSETLELHRCEPGRRELQNREGTTLSLVLRQTAAGIPFIKASASGNRLDHNCFSM